MNRSTFFNSFLILAVTAVFLSATSAAYAELWTPEAMTTSLWVDAADSSTITETDGSVSQWDDKSTNGNHVTQGTDTDQPSTGSRTVNDLNVIDFDKSAYLNRAAFEGGDITGARSAYVVTAMDDTGGTVFTMDDWEGESATTFFARDPKFSYYNGTALDGSASDINPHIRGLILDDTGNGSAYLDGVVDIAADFGDNDMTGIILGGRTGDSHATVRLDGFIAEVIIVSDEHGTDDREKVEGYLAHKWGLEGNLPSDHTYKSAAPVVVPEPSTLLLAGLGLLGLSLRRPRRR